MKKITVLTCMPIICLFLILSGCGETHQHVWQEATCTSPRTCVECGETEGDALGHNWTDAVCTAPRTCIRCGEIDGDALGHDWSEATCVEPETCTRCGETRGEALGHVPSEADLWTPSVCNVCGEVLADPLPSYFDEQGLESMIIRSTYDFTAWYDNNWLDARAMVVSYDIITGGDYVWNSDEKPIVLPEKEGYEWRIVNISMKYRDLIHYSYSYKAMDYYFGDPDFDDDSSASWYAPTIKDTADHGFHVITLYKDDEIEYDMKAFHFEGDVNSIGTEKEYHVIFAANVPVGYDGAVLRLCALDYRYGKYEQTPRKTLFFRFANID